DCWGIEQELLVWFDADGNVHGIPEVTREELLRAQRRTERERQSAVQERQRADALERALDTERLRADAAETQIQQLADYLRSLGIDPDNLPPSGDMP
ncbi:MAG: Uma2 family endonuclease, partial [Prochlorothrix sp.]|nr:Uma2 family endonuclease [Prochlorothrix sp.]